MSRIALFPRALPPSHRPRGGPDESDHASTWRRGHPERHRGTRPWHEGAQGARARGSSERQDLPDPGPRHGREQGTGRAFEADFETGGGKPYYEVMVLGSDGKLTDHHIDANSGQVIKSDNHPIESYFVRLKPSDVQNASTSLKQAVATAEQKAGGRAAEAKAEPEASGVRYKITVVTGSQSQDITVGADGKIVSNK